MLGHEILGGRQHHLKLSPRTWQYHRELGLRYDASPGSSSTNGFQHGYQPFRPFDDEFVVFPLTLMEVSLPDPGSALDSAWAECERLLVDAEEHGAVMTVLWHPRYFSEAEFRLPTALPSTRRMGTRPGCVGRSRRRLLPRVPRRTRTRIDRRGQRKQSRVERDGTNRAQPGRVSRADGSTPNRSFSTAC